VLGIVAVLPIPSSGGTMFKLTIFGRRRADISQDEFLRHWTGEHMTLVQGLPEFRRLVRRCVLQQPVANSLADIPRLPFDGYAELWFDNEADLGTMLQVIVTNEDLARDMAEFTDPDYGHAMVTSEVQIV
jgi:uncharacterized protein (TIGR02118 family)